MSRRVSSIGRASEIRTPFPRNRRAPDSAAFGASDGGSAARRCSIYGPTPPSGLGNSPHRPGPALASPSTTRAHVSTESIDAPDISRVISGICSAPAPLDASRLSRRQIPYGIPRSQARCTYMNLFSRLRLRVYSWGGFGAPCERLSAGVPILGEPSLRAFKKSGNVSIRSTRLT